MTTTKTIQDFYRDALHIYDGGACNPIPLARVLHEFMQFGSEHGYDTKRLQTHAVTRLILAQMSSLAGIGIGECGDAVEAAETFLAVRGVEPVDD